MDIKEIEIIVNDHIKLISVDAKGLADGRNRASKFLVVQSILATFLKDFEQERAKVITVRDATFAQSIRTIDGKNITEKKIYVAEDKEYTKFNELLGELDSVKDYVKTHMKIFENAHLFFRQICKE